MKIKSLRTGLGVTAIVASVFLLIFSVLQSQGLNTLILPLMVGLIGVLVVMGKQEQTGLVEDRVKSLIGGGFLMLAFAIIGALLITVLLLFVFWS